VLQLAAYRVEHLGMRMAEDHRPPGADIVDVALVVFVDHVSALGMLEEQRCAAHATEGAHRRIDAAGDVLLGVGEQAFGTGHGHAL